VSTVEKLIEELEKDCGRDWAELTVTDSDVRLAIIDAVLADVATRSDLEKLRSEIERGSRGSRTGSQHLRTGSTRSWLGLRGLKVRWTSPLSSSSRSTFLLRSL
jgi:hypothetical protein